MTDEKCPACKISLLGEEIPVASRHPYAVATHFSRKIEIYDRELDRTVEYACPDCDARWKR